MSPTNPEQSDSELVYRYPLTGEEWLRSLRNIRLTPAGRRAVELYRAGVPEDQIEPRLQAEGFGQPKDRRS